MLTTPCDSIADFHTLLLQTGAHLPRFGKKWDCPACRGKRCLSVDEVRGLFHCFHAGCDFEGNAVMLRKRLGLSYKVSRSEYRRQQEKRRRSKATAQRLYKMIQDRKSELLPRLRELGRMEQTAHAAGPDASQAWDALATVYTERLKIEAELLILEHAHARDVARFLGLLPGQAGDYEWAIENVMLMNGLTASDGRFILLSA